MSPCQAKEGQEMPCSIEEGKETSYLIHEGKEQPLEVQGIMSNFLDVEVDYLMGITLPSMLDVCLPMLGLDEVEDTTQEVGGLIPTISEVRLPMLSLEKSKIVDGRCHAIGHPSCGA